MAVEAVAFNPDIAACAKRESTLVDARSGLGLMVRGLVREEIWFQASSS